MAGTAKNLQCGDVSLLYQWLGGLSPVPVGPFELLAVDLAFVSDRTTREHFDGPLMAVAEAVFVFIGVAAVIAYTVALALRFVRVIR